MVSGYRAVNRPVAIYWPDEDVLYKGVLTEYKVASGEHKVQYISTPARRSRVWLLTCVSRSPSFRESVLWVGLGNC
jgi:hypothetical protein